MITAAPAAGGPAWTDILTTWSTLALAVLAFVTAALAFLAWRKQAREVSDQAEMLDLQRRQLEAQRDDSAKQAAVLELQAADLRKSIEDRERAERERHESQATGVAAWFAWAPPTSGAGGPLSGASAWGATIRNASSLPVFDVSVFFHHIEEPVAGRGWTPVPAGSATAPVRVLPPMDEKHVMIPQAVRNQLQQCNDSVYTVSIWFTDASGNRWERDARGALKPLE
jgi:hypothetical protein